ncbi:MAG: hypothetical protein HYV95_03575 [Opitutae bacterium]|nr:hypothetical protein [Opitutae bacterium]
MKTYFRQRSFREQLLLLAVAMAGLAWGASVLAKRTAFTVRAWRLSLGEQARQSLLLAQRDEILSRVKEAAKILDPVRTLDSGQSFAELNDMARGLTVELGTPRTEITGSFALHFHQITIRRTNFGRLIEFYDRLVRRAPYLGIEQCLLSSDPGAPGTLNATFRIYSIQIVDPDSGPVSAPARPTPDVTPAPHETNP